MRAFADLYAKLDETTKTLEKVAAMVAYFSTVEPSDGAWAVYFLTGRKPRQLVPSKLLKQWSAEAAGVPEWLFLEAYHSVGDLAETIALLVPPPSTVAATASLTTWVEERMLPLRRLDESAQKQAMLAAWDELTPRERLVLNKLITGSFRVGVSQLLVVRALAEVAAIPAETISHRLMGTWEPTPVYFAGLVGTDEGATAHSRPYPFFLASQLEGAPDDLGDVSDWLAEWKWDGIRSQLIRRAGETFLWSRGEELVTERYPEIRAAGDLLPDGTVIDGEILPWSDGVRPFAELQRRIGRKSVTKKVLADVPVTLLAYDLLEDGGADVRDRPLDWRRARLAELATGRLQLSPALDAPSWAELARVREQSRARQVEGLMLKRRSSGYRTGRVRGDWWKWKVEPFAVDAVMVNAQKGTGKRSGLFSDFTFAVWDGNTLVPFAKAYSGLIDAEMRQVDAWVKRHTTETFGPVRAVKPELVFEIGFEGIQLSTRHKSGIAVRFPRILRWRTDKPPREADTLARVRLLANLADAAPGPLVPALPAARTAVKERGLFDDLD